MKSGLLISVLLFCAVTNFAEAAECSTSKGKKVIYDSDEDDPRIIRSAESNKRRRIATSDSDESESLTAHVPSARVSEDSPPFDIKNTQKMYRPDILRRKRNLKACADWDFEAVIRESLANEGSATESSYPVVISDSEILADPKSSKNISVRVMMKYRYELGFRADREIDETNEEECNFYTFLNWDYLDLTRFEYHKFPIDRIMTTSSFDGVQPEFMPVGLDILEAHFDQIHFHNPRTLEGRRMLLFQRLYRRYEAAMGRQAHPSYISWRHCRVSNWPTFVSQSDLGSWSSEQVTTLNDLLESNVLKFTCHHTSGDIETPEPLGRQQISLPATKIDYAAFTGETCGVSDSRLVCGDPPLEISKAKKKKSKKTMKSEKIVKKKSRESDSESEDSKASPASSIETYRRMDRIDVISDKPADPEKRKQVLQRVLQIFRKDTQQPTATSIDWTLLKVAVLQNHLIPFSLELATEGDVLTLEKLSKNKKFGFLNLKILTGRRMRVFERLYRIYSQQICKCFSVHYQDPFYIRWNDLEVRGWPSGVPTNYNSLKVDELTTLEGLLDENLIKFTLSRKFVLEMTGEDESLANQIYESQFTSETSSNEDSASETSSSETSPRSTATDRLFQEGGARIIFQRDPSLLAAKSTSNQILSDPTPKFSSFSGASSSSVNSHKSLSNLISRRESEMASFELVTDDNIVPNTSYPHLTQPQHSALLETINSSITAFNAMQAAHSSDSRQFKIISEILKCLDFHLKHAQNDPVTQALIPIGILNEFLKIFNSSLRAVNAADSYMAPQDLKVFIVAALRLRARLAGISTKIPMKKSFQIPKSRIADQFLFGFLSQTEGNWPDMELIEFYLYSMEDYSFFKEARSSRIL
jgi:hypothetical protein